MHPLWAQEEISSMLYLDSYFLDPHLLDHKMAVSRKNRPRTLQQAHQVSMHNQPGKGSPQ